MNKTQVDKKFILTLRERSFSQNRRSYKDSDKSRYFTFEYYFKIELRNFWQIVSMNSDNEKLPAFHNDVDELEMKINISKSNNKKGFSRTDVIKIIPIVKYKKGLEILNKLEFEIYPSIQTEKDSKLIKSELIKWLDGTVEKDLKIMLLPFEKLTFDPQLGSDSSFVVLSKVDPKQHKIMQEVSINNNCGLYKPDLLTIIYHDIVNYIEFFYDEINLGKFIEYFIGSDLYIKNKPNTKIKEFLFNFEIIENECLRKEYRQNAPKELNLFKLLFPKMYFSGTKFQQSQYQEMIILPIDTTTHILKQKELIQSQKTSNLRLKYAYQYLYAFLYNLISMAKFNDNKFENARSAHLLYYYIFSTLFKIDNEHKIFGTDSSGEKARDDLHKLLAVYSTLFSPELVKMLFEYDETVRSLKINTAIATTSEDEKFKYIPLKKNSQNRTSPRWNNSQFLASPIINLHKVEIDTNRALRLFTGKQQFFNLLKSQDVIDATSIASFTLKLFNQKWLNLINIKYNQIKQDAKQSIQ